MARFNFWSLFNNSRFEDFFARLTGGSSDHDHLNGTTGGNVLFAGASADSVAGMAGNDMLNGGTGDDKIWGGSGNDTLEGGAARIFWSAASARTGWTAATAMTRCSAAPMPVRW